MELVTLEHPDGRRYRTDSASEVNLLVGSYGYRRVEEKSQNTQSKRGSTKSGNTTTASSTPAPESSTSDEAPSS